MCIAKLPDLIFHYDINFTPDKPKKMLRPAFRIFIATHFPAFVDKVAHDGEKSFYAMTRLMNEGDPFTGTVVVPSPDGGKDKGFSIKVKEAAAVDMRSIKQWPNYSNQQHVRQAWQVMEVILGTAADRSDLIRFKRNIFPIPKTPTQITDLDDLWIGLYQAFVLGRKPYLNVDVHHKAFPRAEQLTVLFNNRHNLDQILKGADVEYCSPFTGDRKRFRFQRLRGSAESETFVDEQDGGKRKTVAAYFAEKGQPLRNPKFPVAWIGPHQRKDNPMLIPIEHLSVPGGQALNRDNPVDAVAAIIRYAAVSTDQRKENIMRIVNTIAYNRVKTINAFGIRVGESFIQVNSHILPPPKLQYNGSMVSVFNGEWRTEKDRFLAPGNCIKWAILPLSSFARRNQIDDLQSQVLNVAKKRGINLSSDCSILPPMDRVSGDRDIPQLEKVINDLKKQNVQMLIVIVKDKMRFKDIYPAVKKSAELRCGILTQCIQDKTLGRLNQSIVENLMLKVNTKLNGTNHVIAQPSQVPLNNTKFMVIGADVTHPSPGQTTIPSVVGVAASCDKYGFRYNCEWRLQDPRDEMIRDLETIVRGQLNIYKRQLGYMPEHILYYRDGVSDGQFKDVSEIEMCAIQRACSGQKVKITFIVVQKRHHTRFFPTKPNTLDRKNNNVVPGTVVDSEIVSPKVEQFFLVSHKSIQGVAKPAKYCVLHDDAKIPADELQVFTYNLCHLFTRCNRAVSYPAPTYYAHLVAYRGRVYIHGERMNFHNLQHEYDRRMIKPNIIKDSPMFFV